MNLRRVVRLGVEIVADRQPVLVGQELAPWSAPQARRDMALIEREHPGQEHRATRHHTGTVPVPALDRRSARQELIPLLVPTSLILDLI
jgi:hypothetical protein